MEHDWRGLPITSADGDLAALIRAFEIDLHHFTEGAGAIFPLAEAAPDCLTAQVYAAAMHLYSQVESEIETDARRLLDRASSLVPAATEREQLLYGAVEAWARSDFAAALMAFEELVGQWPRDVTAVKFAEFVLFEVPDYPRHLRLMEGAAPANQGLACFGAMHAFAHELNGHFDRAQQLAESALETEFDTPWAHHALAHVYLNTNRMAEGQRVVAGFVPSWQDHSVGIRAHNAWHLALLHLGTGDVEQALDVYRDLIAQKDPSSAFEHTDEISFLWRLELMGHEVASELWAPIVPFAEERADDRVFPFMNAHYLYALARAGQGASARAALQRLAARTAPGTEPWRTGLPLLEGVIALAEADWTRGVNAMAPVIDDIARVGGSDAQNDLFLQAYLVGLVKARRSTEARTLLARRIGDRPPNAQENAWLGHAS